MILKANSALETRRNNRNRKNLRFLRSKERASPPFALLTSPRFAALLGLWPALKGAAKPLPNGASAMRPLMHSTNLFVLAVVERPRKLLTRARIDTACGGWRRAARSCSSKPRKLSRVYALFKGYDSLTVVLNKKSPSRGLIFRFFRVLRRE